MFHKTLDEACAGDQVSSLGSFLRNKKEDFNLQIWKALYVFNYWFLLEEFLLHVLAAAVNKHYNGCNKNNHSTPKPLQQSMKQALASLVCCC
jgi:hypothetical protein